MKIFLQLHPAKSIVGGDTELLGDFKVGNINVLNWLFDNKYIEKTDDNSHYLLESSIMMNNLELVKYLLGQVDTEGIAYELLLYASVGASYETFKYLMKKLDYQLTARMVLEAAIFSSTVDILKLAIESYGIEITFHQPALRQALIDVSGNSNEASGDITRILLEHADADGRVLHNALEAATVNYNKWVLGALLDSYPDLCKYVTSSLLLDCCRDADISYMIPTILRCVLILVTITTNRYSLHLEQAIM